MKRFLIVAVMFPMLATSALAESGSNIFLSGKAVSYTHLTLPTTPYV